jgi:hypothetical protein
VTIKFVCGCGKHLKARDDMARMRIVCPKCRQLVGVPGLDPTVAGGEGVMTPQERLRRARENPPTPAEAAAGELLDALAKEEAATPKPQRRVRLMSEKEARKQERSNRHLERHWYESLLYPLRAWRLCLVLALVLTSLSVALATFVPRLLHDAEPADAWEAAMTHVVWVLPALLIAGLPCSFLERVLVSAAGGEVDYILWSGNPVTTFLLAAARWLACFLAGPVLLAAVGWLYWVKSGETSWLDRLILAEVGVVAIAYFVLALASVADRGRWRDLSPPAVADLAHRLRWRALAVVAGAAGLLVIGLVVIAGITEVHRGTLLGWLMLTAGWFLGVFVGTFLARLLGVWCYKTRPAGRS